MRIKSLIAWTITIGLLLCAEFLLCQTNGRPKCFSYEPSPVSLTGTLVRKTFPGPPNYENIRKRDKPETAWLLELDRPACVDEDKTDPDLNPAQAEVHQAQLVLMPEQYRSYKTLVGHKVTAIGTLFGAHTAHHHTPVLLTVRNLSPYNE